MFLAHWLDPAVSYLMTLGRPGFLNPLHMFTTAQGMVGQIILTFDQKPECEKVEINFYKWKLLCQ